VWLDALPGRLAFMCGAWKLGLDGPALRGTNAIAGLHCGAGAYHRRHRSPNGAGGCPTRMRPLPAHGSDMKTQNQVRRDIRTQKRAHRDLVRRTWVPGPLTAASVRTVGPLTPRVPFNATGWGADDSYAGIQGTVVLLLFHPLIWLIDLIICFPIRRRIHQAREARAARFNAKFV
jgi:hypothetical protein